VPGGLLSIPLLRPVVVLVGEPFCCRFECWRWHWPAEIFVLKAHSCAWRTARGRTWHMAGALRRPELLASSPLHGAISPLEEGKSFLWRRWRTADFGHGFICASMAHSAPACLLACRAARICAWVTLHFAPVRWRIGRQRRGALLGQPSLLPLHCLTTSSTRDTRFAALLSVVPGCHS